MHPDYADKVADAMTAGRAYSNAPPAGYIGQVAELTPTTPWERLRHVADRISMCQDLAEGVQMRIMGPMPEPPTTGSRELASAKGGSMLGDLYDLAEMMHRRLDKIERSLSLVIKVLP